MSHTIHLVRGTHRFSFLVALLVMALALTLPHAASAQNPVPTWQAWALSVDFPKQTPHVLYTVYVGTNTPAPTVLSSTTIDISNKCEVVSPTKKLQYDGATAIFDGNAYIKCTVPSWRTQLATLAPNLPGAHRDTLVCTCGMGPMLGGANVRLDPVSGTNPLLDARDLGMTFSLPSDGINAQTQLALSSRTYTSPTWKIDTAAGNRMLMGMNGPAVVAVANYFNWFTYLSPGWDTFFTNNVVGTRMGAWAESPVATWRTPATTYRLKTTSATVYIGHDSVTGANFRGRLTDGTFDPGCFNG